MISGECGCKVGEESDSRTVSTYFQHEVKEATPTSHSLPRLMDVKVKDTHWVHLPLMPVAIVNKQSLPADFQYSNDSTMTAERNQKADNEETVRVKEIKKQTMKRLSE